MATIPVSYVVDDHLLTHDFIRTHGHQPTPAELAHYRRTRARARIRLAARVRRRAGRVITRL